MFQWKRYCLLPLALSAVSVAGWGQSVTQGAITGTVEDASGAVVPKATVTIVNTGTNATVTLTADDKGFFNAPLLQPGAYKVTIAAGGFGQYVANPVTVQVSQTTTLEPRLTTGQTETTVTVTDSTPAINTESPDFSDVLDNRAIVDLPENNRRWSSLALLTPGVVSDANGFGLVSIRGISPILNNVEIDGADDNQAYFSEERGRTREAYSTSEDAVREFQVNTGVYSAEFGRAAGGVINSVTKSGSNQLHGEAYFYDRQSSWGAYNPLAVLATQNANGTFSNQPVKPKDLRKIWGFAAGGAIIKDKLFWYYTYDQHHRLFPAIAQPSNPNTYYTQPSAVLPTGSVCQPNGYETGSSRTDSNYTLDSQVCTLAAREGLTYANAVARYNQDFAALSGDLGTVPRFGDQEINTPKLDFQITPKQRLSVLYHRLRWDSPGGVQTASTVNYGMDTLGNDFVKLDYGLTKLESQITGSISNEVGYQYGRELDYETQQPFTAYTSGNLSNNGNTPEVTFSSSTGAFSLGSPYYSYRLAYPDERKWQVFDTLYYVKGRHSLKFGLDILHNYDLINNTYESNGVFNYTTLANYFADLDGFKGRNTRADVCNPSASSAASSATAVVTGTLPCYSSYAQGYGNPLFDISTLDYGFFAQDNWKVNPRLTLELGVRYDYEQLPNPSATLTQATGNFVPYAGLTNRPSDKNNIGPRAGFAYDVFGGGTTVLRGGFGLYYGRITNGTILNAYLNTGSPLGQYTTTYLTSTPPTAGYPNFPNLTATGSGAAPAQPTSQFFSPNFQNPQVMEYDLLLQQNVGKGTVTNFSYLASQGRELPNFLDVNLNPNQQTSTITFTGGGPIPDGTKVQVPTYIGYGNQNMFGTVATKYQAITEIVSNVNSSYNAFVAEIKNNSIAGFEFDASYTWSHALDYAQNASTSASTNSFYDPYNNFRVNYANSAYNVPNRIAGYVLYRMPNLVHNEYAKYVANGWSINDDFQLQNGLPYSLSLSGRNSSSAISTGLNGAGGQTFVPTSVLGLPGLGRNTYEQRRAITDDIRLIKAIPFSDRYNLELRGDFFNIANHQNISSINTTGYTFSSTGMLSSNAAYAATTFSVPTAINASGFLYTPREIQISARLAF